MPKSNGKRAQLAQYRGHLQECLTVLEALETAALSRDHYKVHIKNHAELATGLPIQDLVRTHQIRKIRAILGSK